MFGPHPLTQLDLSVLQKHDTYKIDSAGTLATSVLAHPAGQEPPSSNPNLSYPAKNCHIDFFAAQSQALVYQQEEEISEYNFTVSDKPRNLKIKQLRINFDFPRTAHQLRVEQKQDHLALVPPAEQALQRDKPRRQRVKFLAELIIGPTPQRAIRDKDIRSIFKLTTPADDFNRQENKTAVKTAERESLASTACQAIKDNRPAAGTFQKQAPMSQAVQILGCTHAAAAAAPEIRLGEIEQDILPSPGEYRAHIFVDASKVAYGAVVFIMTNIDDELICRNAFSKARVAPMAMLTGEEDPSRPSIPRMELLAAVLGVAIGNFVCQVFDITKEHTFYYSDSSINIARLQKPYQQYSTFVANRLKKVHEGSIAANWRWVPTSENISDILSRGTSLQELAELQSWISGPPFLYSGRMHIQPIRLAHQSLDPELKKSAIHGLTALKGETIVALANSPLRNPLLLRLEQVSKYRRLVRVIAVILRWKVIIADNSYSAAGKKPLSLRYPTDFDFDDCTGLKPPASLDKYRTNDKPFHDHSIRRKGAPTLSHDTCFSSEEYQKSEIKLWLLVQEDDTQIRDTVQILRTQTELPKSSKLSKYDPFIGTDCLLRSRTRLQLPFISEARSNPIIIPKQSHIGQLLVLQIHEDLFHAGHNHCAHVLHSKYRLLGGRQILRAHINKCIICRNLKSSNNFYQPKIDNIKEFRLDSKKVFHATSVDYFGPLHTQHKCGKPKCSHAGIQNVFGLVFTCLSTRYCQIFLARDTKAETFLTHFEELCARFSKPQTLVSDCASYFKAASKMLNKMHDRNKAIDGNKVNWIFSTPVSPHSNGSVEQMIFQIKKKLMRILKNTFLTNSQLTQLFFETASLLNGRPLAAQVAGDNFETITPNLLVFGFDHLELISDAKSTRDNIIDVKNDYIKQLRHRRILLNTIWRSFSHSYIEQMTLREKFRDSSKNRQAKLNDVVLTFDEKRRKSNKLGDQTTSARGVWIIGRLTEIYPDKKTGIVRSAKVLLPDKRSFIRSVRRLAFLENMEPE